MDYDAIIKYLHLNSTLSEKFGIFCSDPEFFYVSNDKMVGRGYERIKALDNLKEEAIKEENYELCVNILLLRDVLIDIYKIGEV